MAESATLVVVAEDPNGHPIEGVEFLLGLSPDERFSRHADASNGFRFHARGEDTDADGLAVFQQVPAKVHLSLTVDGGLKLEATDADGVLARNGDAETPALWPLTARANKPTRAIYRGDGFVRVKGRVLEADGTPSANARLTFAAVNEETEDTAITPARARTADDGTFDVGLSMAAPGPAPSEWLRFTFRAAP